MNERLTNIAVTTVGGAITLKIINKFLSNAIKWVRPTTITVGRAIPLWGAIEKSPI